MARAGQAPRVEQARDALGADDGLRPGHEHPERDQPGPGGRRVPDRLIETGEIERRTCDSRLARGRVRRGSSRSGRPEATGHRAPEPAAARPTAVSRAGGSPPRTPRRRRRLAWPFPRPRTLSGGSNSASSGWRDRGLRVRPAGIPRSVGRRCRQRLALDPGRGHRRRIVAAVAACGDAIDDLGRSDAVTPTATNASGAPHDGQAERPDGTASPQSGQTIVRGSMGTSDPRPARSGVPTACQTLQRPSSPPDGGSGDPPNVRCPRRTASTVQAAWRHAATMPARISPPAHNPTNTNSTTNAATMSRSMSADRNPAHATEAAPAAGTRTSSRIAAGTRNSTSVRMGCVIACDHRAPQPAGDRGAFEDDPPRGDAADDLADEPDEHDDDDRIGDGGDDPPDDRRRDVARQRQFGVRDGHGPRGRPPDGGRGAGTAWPSGRRGSGAPGGSGRRRAAAQRSRSRVSAVSSRLAS